MAIPKSGYTLPNRLARTYLLALQEVMGQNGVGAILNLAGLEPWIANYPPGNWEREVDFADFSSIQRAVEEMYGPRGGGGLSRRAAWATYEALRKAIGLPAGAIEVGLRFLPLSRRLHYGMRALAWTAMQGSDQDIRMTESEDGLFFSIHRCPVCWGRQTEKPACHAAVGLIEQALRRMSGGHAFAVEEIRCTAAGDRACVVQVGRQPIA